MASTSRQTWQVIVGNIGTVYDGDDYREAERTFQAYVSQSKDGYGRAAGEAVTLLTSTLNGQDIAAEWEGTIRDLDVDE